MPVDLSDANMSRAKDISLQCTCGYSFTSSMERRRHYRKSVNLKGRYHYSNQVELEQGSGNFVGKGKMNILDVSAWGLKVKLKKKEMLKLNDQLSVEFQLDDKKRTMIREKATVKNIDKKFIGGAFTDQRTGNRSLGFYLLG
jgi:hypothetical protein